MARSWRNVAVIAAGALALALVLLFNRYDVRPEGPFVYKTDRFTGVTVRCGPRPGCVPMQEAP